VNSGWTACCNPGRDDKKDSETNKSFPSSVWVRPATRAVQQEGLTNTPPKPYTEATLLGAMETAGKLVATNNSRKPLKQKAWGRRRPSLIIETAARGAVTSPAKKRFFGGAGAAVI